MPRTEFHRGCEEVEENKQEKEEESNMVSGNVVNLTIVGSGQARTKHRRRGASLGNAACSLKMG